MNHPTYDALLQTVIAAKGLDRWDSMSILADWLEDQGNPVAAGWREMAKRKKCPEFHPQGSGWWVWWVFDKEFNNISYSKSVLRREVWRRLTVPDHAVWHTCKDYLSLEEALEDAARAYGEWLTIKRKVVK